MKRIFIPLTMLATVLVLLSSCSESKDEIDDLFIQTAHIIKGKVEKGPLVRGSSVEMRTLDKDMTPTGSSYSASIENNSGDFNYGSLKINSPYAKLTAEGYFFNEVKGSLSVSPIKLDAIVDLSDNQTINVNVLTHLKSQRIVHLVTSENISYKEANEQAQEEILKVFGLQEYSLKDVSQFSVVGGDDAAGALIAVSSLIISDRSEAQIVEFLSKLTTEFSTSGSFSDSSKKQLRQTMSYLNGEITNIGNNIVNRYKELGYDVTVKDLAYFFDWDGDGIAGNEIEEGATVELDKTHLDVPSVGGDFTITIKSDKPYYLTSPGNSSNSDTNLDTTPGNSITEENYYSSLYETGYEVQPDIELSGKIEKQTITIHVDAAKFRKEKSTSISVFNVRGHEAATISITQQGDENIIVNIPKLGENGKSAFSAALLEFSNAVYYKQLLEGNYGIQTTKQPYTASNSNINSCWSQFYKSVNILLTIKSADANARSCYQEYINTHLALAYYNMTSYWNNIPFFMTYQGAEGATLPATKQNEICSTLEKDLLEALPVLEEKRNESMTDANNAFFVSKDVARIVLAYLYVSQKDYNSALPYLEKVVNNGYYSLTTTFDKSHYDNEECIFGLAIPTRSTGAGVRPLLDYKEVLLTLAECYHHTGDESKAKAIISKICTAKGITSSESDVLKIIANIRYQLQTPYYLPFIKRNNLGTSVMGLNESQLYQLLWPIPASEMMYNPNLRQNPGY